MRLDGGARSMQKTGHVAAGRERDDNRVVDAFGLVVFFQPFPEAVGFNASDRVSCGIEDLLRSA
jgi:hypothetical protein